MRRSAPIPISRRRADDRARRISGARRRPATSIELDALGREARRRAGRRAVAARRRAAAASIRIATRRSWRSTTTCSTSCASSATTLHYEDPRNSFLNEVLDRRTGIPITLALVYMEVARRAGLHVEGINFPGHFLLRCRGAARPAVRRGPDHRRVSRRRAAVGERAGCARRHRRRRGSCTTARCCRARPSRRSSRGCC